MQNYGERKIVTVSDASCLNYDLVIIVICVISKKITQIIKIKVQTTLSHVSLKSP
ncbi:MAG: hypothetical protein LBP59_04200 [Planctomycetaceae bacterium]|nr:hypothetical protein [Planctomycetaceae bacterium]